MRAKIVTHCALSLCSCVIFTAIHRVNAGEAEAVPAAQPIRFPDSNVRYEKPGPSLHNKSSADSEQRTRHSCFMTLQSQQEPRMVGTVTGHREQFLTQVPSSLSSLGEFPGKLHLTRLGRSLFL